MSGYRLTWKGDAVLGEVKERLAQAMGEIGLRVEGKSKRKLYKGHGVLTGTLRRSIHTAAPGYNWGQDADGGDELGGEMAEADVQGERLVVQVGSGLRYAMPVHQGHEGFEGYHFITEGAEEVRGEVPEVVEKYRI